MHKTVKKWLSGAIILITPLSVFLGGILTAKAGTYTEPEIKITEHSAGPETFNPDTEKYTVNYCINKPAYITVGIYERKTDTTSYKVNLLSNEEFKSAGCYKSYWNGTNGQNSEIGEFGERVEDGTYFYGIRAKGVSGYSTGSDYTAGWLFVDTDISSKVRILDIDVNNQVFDPWDSQNAEFTFSIDKGADITFEIIDEDDDEIVTLIEDEYHNKGEYTVFWDGRDMYNEIADEDEYTYVLTAKENGKKDVEKGTVHIKKGYYAGEETEDPRFKNVYTLKDSIDPGRGEKAVIVFTTLAKADITVKIFDKNDNKVETIAKQDDVKPGTYSAAWDGIDDISGKETYKYQIYAVNDNGSETAEGQITIEEDEKTSNKPNIFKDKASPVPFKPGTNLLEISFKLDKEADVTIEIRDGNQTFTEIIEDQKMYEGSHEVTWTGFDEYGDLISNGIYRYKLIAANARGKDVEFGYFSVEDAKYAVTTDKCAGFEDVSDSYRYCDAIQWAKNKGIFSGYSDGSFRPDQAISRAEAVKVILEATNVRILSRDGTYLGFKDTAPYEWYAGYLRTALSLGIINGYKDGYFRPINMVTRAEGLTIMLKTGIVKDNIIIPTNTYGSPYYDSVNNADNMWYMSYLWYAKENNLIDAKWYFYPNHALTRGFMADMLYRYSKNI